MDDPTATPEQIEGALAVLRAAGWEVREDRGFGQLIETDPPILAQTWYDPESRHRHYARTVVQQRWTEAAS